MSFFENKEIKERKKELSLQPNDPAAHFNLGTAYDKAGKLHDAIKEFEATIKIHPNSAEARPRVAAVQSFRDEHHVFAFLLS